MRIAAIVLAAGEGRRAGGPKALLTIEGTTFLARTCQLFLDAGASPVVAVLGAQAERVKREGRAPDGVSVSVNGRWQHGMLSSVLCGLDEAEAAGAEAVLVHPVDHPLVASATIGRLVSALRVGAAIAVPVWQGRRGHPGGFARALFDEIRAASPEQGARAVLAGDPARVTSVPGDPGCLAGIDTPADWRRLIG